MNIVIYRENTEDVYSGVEWEAETEEAKAVIAFINDKLGKNVRPGSVSYTHLAIGSMIAPSFSRMFSTLSRMTLARL